MAYKRKTYDEWQVQQHWEDYWEPVAWYGSFKEGRQGYKEYRQNQPATLTRLVKVRVPIDPLG